MSASLEVGELVEGLAESAGLVDTGVGAVDAVTSNGMTVDEAEYCRALGPLQVRFRNLRVTGLRDIGV